MTQVVTRKITLLALPLVLAAQACSGGDGGGPADAGELPDSGATPDLCTDGAPCTLSSGVMGSDYVAPAMDEDRWTLEVPTAGSLLQVVVSNDADFSPIRLEVALFGPSGAAVATRSFTGNGKQRIDLQLVAEVAGTYALVVRDSGNDAADRRNPYFVVATIFAETDNNEPNETSAQATRLTIGAPASGVIGAQGDRDWFSFEVPANQLVEVALSALSPPVSGGVRLEYVLWDPTATIPIAESVEGSAQLVENRAVGNAAGTYFIEIRDDPSDGEQADLTRPYSLTVRLNPEPDMNELAAPNDDPAQPTTLNAGQTITGYIASKADQDWYDIRVRDVPALITVTAAMDPASPVDLSFTVTELDGVTQVCASADSCKAFRFVPEDATTRPREIATSHVVTTPGRYLVVVRDFQDNEYDVARSYTVRVDLPPEPDVHETYDDRRAGARVIAASTSTTGTTIQYPWVQGWLSYADDVDWYAFELPGPAGASPGQNGDWLIQLEVDVDPTPLELQLFLYAVDRDYGGFGRQCGRPAPGDPDPTGLACQFSDAENAMNATYGESNGDCIVVFREHTGAGPHFIRVSDLNRDDFDVRESAPYRLRVSVTAGCGPNSRCVGRYTQGGQDLCLRP